MNVTSTAKYGEDAIIKINIFEGVNGNISINSNNININTTLIDGYSEVSLGVLPYGEHNISVYFKGNDKYPEIIMNHTISVGANIEIDEEVIYNGYNEITFELPEDATGNITINISSMDIVVIPLSGSIVSYALDMLKPGDYSVNITYSGDDYYKSESLTTNITVIPQIIIPDEITTGDNKFSIILPSDGDGTLTVNVDGVESEKNIVNGSCSIIINNITSGEHVISVKYSGDEKYDEYSYIFSSNVVKITPDININVRDNLIEDDTAIVDIYIADDANGILLVDFNGNKLYSDVISGHTSVNLGSLSKGLKIVSYNYLGNVKYNNVVKVSSFNVLSKPRIVSNDLNMYYHDGSVFTVQVFGNDEKPVAGDIVSFTINGKTYTTRSNVNGYAYLKISKSHRTYTITTNYKSTTVTNTIVVKSILKSSNVKIKNSTKKFTLKAKLKKHLKGKKITFKIKGKTFKSKTNSQGVAKVVVKKSFIKKLKIKKYKIKIKFYGETIYKTLKVSK